MKFECTFCGKRIEASEEWYGSAANCPHCDRPIRVPDPIRQAQSKSEVSRAARRHERKARDTKLTIVLLGVLGLIAGICAVYFLWPVPHAKEVRRIGDVLRNKIESSIEARTQPDKMLELTSASVIYAKETSLIPGIEWNQRYTPTIPPKQPVNGILVMSAEELYEKVRTQILNPKTDVSELPSNPLSPDEYQQILAETLAPEDLKSLERIRSDTKCWENFTISEDHRLLVEAVESWKVRQRQMEEMNSKIEAAKKFLHRTQ